MIYAEYTVCQQLTRQELVAHANGSLVSDPPSEFATLPLPPMLMVDRVTEIVRNGSRGRICAEQDVHLDAWYFLCHFRNDPVQPGSLGVDAVWQLIGLYLTLCGARGAGRALGCGAVEFEGQIRPYNRCVRYEIEIDRISMSPKDGTGVAIATARVLVDGVVVYKIGRAKVATFLGIGYTQYPNQGPNCVGGLLL
jgi:3-hydroxyacyl-[acyl-carrier protein] dehydratase / trans-2-decenoyl-[acyl-carrier protein] isomerase